MSVFSNPASRSAEHAADYIAAVLGLLGDQDALPVLEQTAGVFRTLAAGLTPAQLSRPEAPGKWSIRQILRHMADSELVWGFRVRMVLAQHRPPITGYDQDLWADRLGYAEADVQESLAEFAVLRAANLRLIRAATPDDLQRVGVHAERGEESVAHMIRLYAGHDLLHIAQLTRVRDAVR